MTTPWKISPRVLFTVNNVGSVGIYRWHRTSCSPAILTLTLVSWSQTLTQKALRDYPYPTCVLTNPNFLCCVFQLTHNVLPRWILTLPRTMSSWEERPSSVYTQALKPDKLILVPARMCMQFIVLFMLLLVNLAVLYSMDSCFNWARSNMCYLVLSALTLAIQ